MDILRRRVETLSSAGLLSEQQLRAVRKASRVEAALNSVNGAFDLPRYDGTLEALWWASRDRANTEERRSKAETRGTASLDIGRDMELSVKALALGAVPASSGAAEMPQFELTPTDLEFCVVLDPAARKDSIVTFVEHQRGLCKGCRDPLEKRGIFGTPSYAARFCHYTGFYYCHSCCSGRRALVPSRCLQLWDFEERTVCDSVADTLELQAERPNICITAINPALLVQCPLLQTCRQLRTQLCLLTSIGAHCSAFVTQFFAPPQQFQQRSLHDERDVTQAAAYVPRDKYHMVLDSECWSLRELAEIQRYSPFLASAAAAPNNTAVPLSAHEATCPLYQSLRRWRAQMVRHVAQSCHRVCYGRAARSCPACIKDDIIFPFDVENVVVCHRCDTVFHRRCWDRLDNGCTTCTANARRAVSGDR